LKLHLGPLAGIHPGPIGTANGLAFAYRPIAPFFIGLEQVVTGAHSSGFRNIIERDKVEPDGIERDKVERDKVERDRISFGAG
jgi:hypothetical protein